jgi:hypothetical protein
MSITRKLVICFWVFVAAMLLWQFYTYNESMRQAALEHPQQTSFWYTNAVVHPNAPVAQVHHDGAEVVQSAYSAALDTPTQGNVTCKVTLKNVGNATATGIQINVRPYRGGSTFDEDVGQSKVIVLTDDDPRSRYGEWLDFPDLKPGESSTQTASFMMQGSFKPGKNLNPDIVFKSVDKAKP